MFSQFINNSGSVSWRDKVKDLKAGRAEYGKVYSIMTDFERMAVERSIAEYKKNNEPSILAGAFSEYHAAMNKVNAAVVKVKTAKEHERARWDASKLSAEMSVTENLVKIAINKPDVDPKNPLIDRLKTIYQDIHESGDLYKQRAAAEVFTGLVGMIGGNNLDLRASANWLAKQAEKDALQSRDFPELNTAMEEIEAASKEFNQSKQALWQLDYDLGDQNPNGTIGNWSIRTELQKTVFNDDGTIAMVDNLNDPRIEKAI